MDFSTDISIYLYFTTDFPTKSFHDFIAKIKFLKKLYVCHVRLYKERISLPDFTYLATLSFCKTIAFTDKKKSFLNCLPHHEILNTYYAINHIPCNY